MKIKDIFICFISCLLGCCLAVTACGTMDKIVAMVDNTPITQSELNKKIAMLRSHGNNMDEHKLRQLVLDELINTTLLLNLAHRRGITIGEKQLDKVIMNVAKSNGLTIIQLQKEVEHREHISFEEFRRQLRTQALISEVQHQQALDQEIAVSELDIAAVLNSSNQSEGADTQYQLTDIIFTIPENISQTRLAAINNLAKDLAKKLQSGTEVTSSIDEIRKKLRPDETLVVDENMGWRRTADLPEIFVQEVVKLQKIGQVIGPIKAPNGLHLLRLKDFNSGTTTRLTREQATNIAYAKKTAEKIAPLIKELRSKTYVKIY